MQWSQLYPRIHLGISTGDWACQIIDGNSYEHVFLKFCWYSKHTWFGKIRRISKALSWLILMPLLASRSTDLHFPVFAWIINPTNIGKRGSFFLKCRKCFISFLSSISARPISSSSVRVTALPCLSTQRPGTLTNIFPAGELVECFCKRSGIDWTVLGAMLDKSIVIHACYWFPCENRYTVIFITAVYRIFNIFNDILQGNT